MLQPGVRCCNQLKFVTTITKKRKKNSAARFVKADVPDPDVEIKHELVVDEEYTEKELYMKIKNEKSDVSSIRKKRMITDMSSSYAAKSKYCEERKLEYESDCPTHRPLVYMDNTEVCYESSSTEEVNKNGDVSYRTTVGDREEYTPLRLTENKMSVNIWDCQKMSLDMNITQNSDNVTLPDIESSRLSEHESCVSDKIIKIESDADSESCESCYAGEKSLLSYDCGMRFVDSNRPKISKKLQPEMRMLNSGVVCGVGFSQTGELKNHTREKPHTCDICGVGFARTDHLKRHKSIHAGDKPYKCDVCGVGFSRLSHLKSHTRIHTGEKPFKCDICDMRFSERSGLKRHTFLHTGEKPNKCDVCGAAFSQIDHLKSHERTHTGEKPFKCDFCGVGFSTTSNLNIHKRIHTGEKPFKCDLCGMEFSRGNHLKRHSVLHARENPSCRCDVCGMGFSQQRYLNRHLRIHKLS